MFNTIRTNAERAHDSRIVNGFLGKESHAQLCSTHSHSTEVMPANQMDSRFCRVSAKWPCLLQLASQKIEEPPQCRILPGKVGGDGSPLAGVPLLCAGKLAPTGGACPA